MRKNVKRARARWLEGAPSHVADCFGPGKDGFTYGVLFTPIEGDEAFGLEASENPYHPQGVGLSFSIPARSVGDYRRRYAKRRMRWQDLPPLVQKCAQEHFRNL